MGREDKQDCPVRSDPPHPRFLKAEVSADSLVSDRDGRHLTQCQGKLAGAVEQDSVLAC